MKDYHLHELSPDKFEELVIHICRKILGAGVMNFSAGPDGGRDGKFEGTANLFPSKNSPAVGKFIIQAKHTSNPVAKCSDAEFKNNVLKKEFPRIKNLKNQGAADNYLLFTNRKLSGIEEPKLVAAIKKETGVANVWALGVETIVLHLQDSPDIVKTMGLSQFQTPLRIFSQDIADVIKAFHAQKDGLSSKFDYTYTKIKKKNQINKLTVEYFKYIQQNSEPYFAEIQTFLGRPQNKQYEDMYYAIANELKGKIITIRNQYGTFDEIMGLLYDTFVEKCPELQNDKRRFVSVFLHYMYCSCDIGQKC